MTEGTIIGLVYIIVAIILGGIWAFLYGRENEEDKNSWGWAVIPYACLLWPAFLILIPIALFVTGLEKLGKKSKGKIEEEEG